MAKRAKHMKLKWVGGIGFGLLVVGLIIGLLLIRKSAKSPPATSAAPAGVVTGSPPATSAAPAGVVTGSPPATSAAPNGTVTSSPPATSAAPDGTVTGSPPAADAEFVVLPMGSGPDGY